MKTSLLDLKVALNSLPRAQFACAVVLSALLPPAVAWAIGGNNGADEQHALEAKQEVLNSKQNALTENLQLLKQSAQSSQQEPDSRDLVNLKSLISPDQLLSNLVQTVNDTHDALLLDLDSNIVNKKIHNGTEVGNLAVKLRLKAPFETIKTIEEIFLNTESSWHVKRMQLTSTSGANISVTFDLISVYGIHRDGINNTAEVSKHAH